MASILQCLGVSKSYSAEVLLQDISLAIEDGDRVGLIGPNGAGKSTLLKLMAEVEALDEGEIRVQRHLDVIYTPQHVPFEASQTVEEILKAAWQVDCAEHERSARMDRYLRDLDIAGETVLDTLSGGWQKRV